MARYALQWESKNLIAVSTAVQDWLTSSNWFGSSFYGHCKVNLYYDEELSMTSRLLLLGAGIAMELMKQGAMMTVLKTLLAALAWPATLIFAADLIDSKWTIAVDRLTFLS